jgi:hypothetical protein
LEVEVVGATDVLIPSVPSCRCSSCVSSKPISIKAMQMI